MYKVPLELNYLQFSCIKQCPTTHATVESYVFWWVYANSFL